MNRTEQRLQGHLFEIVPSFPPVFIILKILKNLRICKAKIFYWTSGDNKPKRNLI